MSYGKFGRMILFLCCLHLGLGCVGQKVKSKSVTIGERIELHGVVEFLQPSQTFAVEVPAQLLFYKEKPGTLSKAPMTTYAKIKAKEVKGGEPADYTFKIVTPGIGIIDSVVSSKRTNGYFGEINYTFPGSLEVYNKEGKVIKHYILRDERIDLHISYHRTFLAAQSQQSMFDTRQPVYGFASETAMLEAFRKEKDNVYARIEATELEGLISLAQEIMAFGFGTYVWPYKFTYMELDKNGQAAYPGLTQEIQKYSGDLGVYINASDDGSLLNKFAEYGDFFASQLKDEFPAEVITCCAFNAICCYCIAEDLEQADALFRKYKKSFGFFVTPRLDDFSYGYAIRRAMRDQEEVIYYQKQLSFSDRMKAEAEAEAKALTENELAARDEAFRAEMERLSKRNVRKVYGYVIDKDGNKYEGKLVANFIAVSSGMADMSIGKHVMVYPKEGKVRGFGPARVQYFVADSTYFFPLKEFAPASLKAVGALSGGLSRAFYERIYETEHYTLYFDRSVKKDSYLVGEKGAGEAVPFVWIQVLNSGAIAKLVIPDVLQERIKAGEFGQGDIDGVKAFMDALEKQANVL